MTVHVARVPSGLDTRRFAAWAGFVAVAGNVLGVAFLNDMPSAYRLGRLGEWVLAVRVQPASTVASAACFTLGLLGLAAWAGHLGRVVDTPSARLGAWVLAWTTLLNAAGSLLPILPALGSAPSTGLTLLHASLSLDALFNLGLGLGLPCIAWQMRGPAWVRVLAFTAGLTSIPVAGQAIWDAAASMLYVSAPLWLALILVTSITWLRSDAVESR